MYSPQNKIGFMFLGGLGRGTSVEGLDFPHGVGDGPPGFQKG